MSLLILSTKKFATW